MRLVILGGYGCVGSALTQLLMESTDAEIVIAGRRRERAEEAAVEWNSRYPGKRVAGIWADATDPELLRREVFRAVEMAVVACPVAACAEDIANAALHAGIDYIDVHPSQTTWARLRPMSGNIERAGRCFITEAGWVPGIPSVMVRYAASRQPGLERAFVGAPVHPRWTHAQEDDLLELLDDLRSRPKGTKRGFPFGACRPARLEEMRTLPKLIPGLREAAFYTPPFGALIESIVRPLARLILTPSKRRGWKRLSRLARRGLPKSLPSDARIVLDAGQAGFTLEHDDARRFAAISAAACLLQYLDGSARRPGLHFMGHIVDPERMLGDVERLGIKRNTNAVAASGTRLAVTSTGPKE